MTLSNIKGIQNNLQRNKNFASYLESMMFQLLAYSENRYTVYISVVLNNNPLGTVDIVFINKHQFLIHFNFLIYKNQSSAWIVWFHIIMSFLTRYENNLIVHGFCPPSHYKGRGGAGGVIWYENLPKFCGGKIFSDICTRKNL